MEARINITKDGIKKYPIHSHDYYEIMLYLQGEGYLATKSGNYAFSPGTIIIVPPGTEHGSVSDDGFKNISIGGDFGAFFSFRDLITINDSVNGEGRTLATLIYDNRFCGDGYLQSLISAYLYFLVRRTENETEKDKFINNIVSAISDSFFDAELKLSDLLRRSGYAEDYARALFKKRIGKTPNGFLTDLRINHACFLIDVYGGMLSLVQIAEQCGYVDYVYFSKKFKAVIGVSPDKYRKNKKHDI